MRHSVALLGALFVVAACRDRETAHDHALEHPAGHNHHEDGHGHGETPVVRLTRFSEQLELFAEHPALVAGQEATLLAHVTVLESFRALEGATLTLELSGAAPLTATAARAVRPGIYELAFVPPTAGKYRGALRVSGSVTDSFSDLEFEAFASAEGGEAQSSEHEDGQFIELLKEQQWGVPFGTSAVRTDTIIASIEVAGSVTTPPGGTAEVSAAVAGRLVPPARGLPRPGDFVKKGQLLAMLAPAPSSPEEAARASLGVTEAKTRLERARASVARAERLLRDQAISQREVEDARREVSVAEAAEKAARGLEDLFLRSSGGGGAGTWRLVSPIEGTLTAVEATPGASVGPETVLFRVVDMRELWIHARVPEEDAARLRRDRDAAFQVPGVEGLLLIDLTGDDASADLVTVGRTVDPTSRTVDIFYSLRKPDARLRVGGLVRVTLPVGADHTGVVVPRSALIEDGGREVVYVQMDGEHFQERPVRTGPRQGDRSAVVEGLKEGERVVTRGAHIVRLAARASAGAPHGHIH